MNFSQKASKTPPQSHDLNINAYSLDELLDLFHLDYNMNVTDLKQAKKRVLQLHPDKSRLPPEYFLFYKKAYEKIVQLYEDLDRQNRTMTKEATIYNSEVYGPNGRDTVFTFDKNIKREIDRTAANEKNAAAFNRKFNDLFEKNMRQAPDPTKNKWFSAAEDEENDTPYKTPTSGVSANNIGRVIEDMKNAAAASGKSTALIQRQRGAREHYHSAVGGTTLYDDDENDDGAYISSSSLFGGLKFEDIRRVHKDETIIPVGTTVEIAQETAARAITLDDFVAQREKVKDAPMAKDEAERILAEKEKRERVRIMEQQHRANLKAEEYLAKSKTVLASMRMLTHN